MYESVHKFARYDGRDDPPGAARWVVDPDDDARDCLVSGRDPPSCGCLPTWLKRRNLGRRRYNATRRVRARVRQLLVARLITRLRWRWGAQTLIARYLGVSQPTISRDLLALEQLTGRRYRAHLAPLPVALAALDPAPPTEWPRDDLDLAALLDDGVARQLDADSGDVALATLLGALDDEERRLRELLALEESVRREDLIADEPSTPLVAQVEAARDITLSKSDTARVLVVLEVDRLLDARRARDHVATVERYPETALAGRGSR